MPDDGDFGAREWGEYTCDLPEKTVDNLLDYIINEVKPDIVFWTGDNSPHNTFDNTEE
jgi:sphingomyelin phosphodiesterase